MKAALLRRAAAEHFIEGYLGAEIQRKIEGTAREYKVRAIEAERPRRTVPDGYFVWVAHLLWLERMLEIVQLPLTAAEVEGLAIVKRERLRFQAQHPACPHCGMPNEPEAFSCRECFGKIKD